MADDKEQVDRLDDVISPSMAMTVRLGLMRESEYIAFQGFTDKLQRDSQTIRPVLDMIAKDAQRQKVLLASLVDSGFLAKFLQQQKDLVASDLVSDFLAKSLQMQNSLPSMLRSLGLLTGRDNARAEAPAVIVPRRAPEIDDDSLPLLLPRHYRLERPTRLLTTNQNTAHVVSWLERGQYLTVADVEYISGLERPDVTRLMADLEGSDIGVQRTRVRVPQADGTRKNFLAWHIKRKTEK